MNTLTFDHETRARIRGNVVRGDFEFFERRPERAVRMRLTVPCEAPVPIDSTYLLVLWLGEHRFARIPLSDDMAAGPDFLRHPCTSREDWAA